MARLFAKANPDNISFTGHLGDPSAITVAAWIKASARDTSGSEIISLGDSVIMRLGGSGQLDGIYYDGAYESLFSGTSVQTGVYVHCCYSVSDGAQEIYTNGASRATATAAGAPAYTVGANTFIGKHGNGGTNNDMDGDIAELAVWNRVLSDDEVAILGADRFSPAFIPNGLIFYLPMIRDIKDLKAATSLTINGTTVSDHPRIIYPSNYNIAPFTAVAAGTSVKDIIGMGVVPFAR